MEKSQFNNFAWILMKEGFDPFKKDYFDSQFFAKLTMQTGFGAFTGFAFTAREFPQTTEVDMGMTLGNEQFSVPKNQARRNLNEVLSCWFWILS